MASQKDILHAKEVFKAICNSLDEIGWRYSANEEKLAITFVVNGDDLPMEFVILADAERQIIRLLSLMPFKAAEDKRVELAIATSLVNYQLADGSFDTNIEDGTLLFRITSSFRSSLISTELIKYLVGVSCNTIDDYNDQFLALCKGNINLEEFIKNNNL